ncbi:hypothetical protein Vretimale_4644 [Volvox reticuliferus]|nr:hypothetical protein Vretimale_4644 [Volvox reticuliferus]
MNRDILKASGMQSGEACLGGSAVSAAKRRRLAALDDALSAVPPKTNSDVVRAVIPAPVQPASVSKTRTNTQGQAVAASSEFPYNRLEDAVLDGSLSAALATAKGAALAAETSAASSRAMCSVRLTGMAKALPPKSTTRTVAAIGGDSVAAEVFAQLVATNWRSCGGDLRCRLAQTLQDRAVTLDNPTAPVKVNKLFARRGTNYSAKLRAVRQQNSIDPRPGVNLTHKPR